MMRRPTSAALILGIWLGFVAPIRN